jgi:hypothetical protein
MVKTAMKLPLDGPTEGWDYAEAALARLEAKIRELWPMACHDDDAIDPNAPTHTLRRDEE